jgi:hypothetical protein
MASEHQTVSPNFTDDRDRAALRFAIKKSRLTLRWLTVWPALARSLVSGAFAAAAWIALLRFTLINLPLWLAIALFLVVIAFSVGWSYTRPVPASRAARFLDSRLSLDERLSTLLELKRSVSHLNAEHAKSQISTWALNETSTLVLERLDKLPRRMTWRPSRKEVVTIALALTALFAVVVVPTPLDAVRAEQAALTSALEKRIGNLEALRLEIAADPFISAETKKKLDGELWELLRKLRTPGLERSELVAALSDAEEKLRSIPTTPVPAFDSLLQAAQMTVDRAVNTSFWVEDILESETELSRAADAASYLSRFATRFSEDEDRAIALTFDQAAQVTGQTHPLFTSDFTESAEAIRTKNGAVATRKIDQIARRFREADSALHTSQSMEHTLSQLDETRHDVAQAGTIAKKRGQVGFRRRGTASQQRATSTSLTSDSSGLPVANTPVPAQGIAPESNSPQQGIGPSAQAARTTTPGSNDSSAMPGPPSGGDKTKSSSDNPSGSGSTSQDDIQGPSKSGPGGGGEGSSPGTLQGTLSGPVGGTSGAISRVPNPSGSGSAGTAQSSGGTPDHEGGDELSIPEPSTVDTTGSGSGNGDSGSGQGGEGGQALGDGTDSNDRSSGRAATIKTPYKDVIRDYTDRANQALQRTYIPSDAKEYVKQYFTVLGQ